MNKAIIAGTLAFSVGWVSSISYIRKEVEIDGNFDVGDKRFVCRIEDKPKDVYIPEGKKSDKSN